MSEVVFKFPIAIFGIYADTDQVCNAIIDFTIVNDSKKLDEDTVDHLQYDIDLENEPLDYDENNQLHKRILITSGRKRIILNSVENTIDKYKLIRQELKEFVNEYFDKNKNHLWCKLPKDIVFKSRDENFNCDYLKVLSAVNGILGSDRDNQPDSKKITIARIQAAAAGFKSNKLLPDSAETLSYYQVLRITNKLEKLNFIGKYTRKNRFTYYSTIFKDYEQLCRQVELKFTNQKSKKEQIRKKVIDEIERNR